MASTKKPPAAPAKKPTSSDLRQRDFRTIRKLAGKVERNPPLDDEPGSYSVRPGDAFAGENYGVLDGAYQIAGSTRVFVFKKRGLVAIIDQHRTAYLPAKIISVPATKDG